jgi:hypothetical protein
VLVSFPLLSPSLLAFQQQSEPVRCPFISLVSGILLSLFLIPASAFLKWYGRSLQACDLYHLDTISPSFLSYPFKAVASRFLILLRTLKPSI